MQRNVNQTHSKKKLSVFIVIIAVLAVALGAAVWISDNGKKGWIDVNADIGADKLSKIQLEAKSPVEFPKDPITVTKSIEPDSSYDTGCVDGTFKYVIKNVEIYDNPSDAGINLSKLNDIMKYNHSYLIHGTDGKKSIYLDSASYLFDGKTERFIDDCYLMIFEIEVTNVDAVYHMEDRSFNYLNTDIFRADTFFKLYTYNEEFKYDKKNQSIDGYYDFECVYIKETAKSETGKQLTFKAPKGQATTLHVGFIAFDNSNDGFTRVGLQFCEQSVTECIENNHIYWFNMSVMLEDYKKSRA